MISIKLFKVAANVGNPPLFSGVIAVSSGPKSHTLTVILAVFASQPRWRHKQWKSLFHVYSPHLRSRKLFKCTQLIAVLSGPLFISWSATNLTMSVFSFENEHTPGLTHYDRAALPTPKRQESSDSRPRAGKSIENIKKVVRYAKFPSGWPTAHDNFATV